MIEMTWRRRHEVEWLDNVIVQYWFGEMGWILACDERLLVTAVVEYAHAML